MAYLGRPSQGDSPFATADKAMRDTSSPQPPSQRNPLPRHQQPGQIGPGGFMNTPNPYGSVSDEARRRYEERYAKKAAEDAAKKQKEEEEERAKQAGVQAPPLQQQQGFGGPPRPPQMHGAPGPAQGPIPGSSYGHHQPAPPRPPYSPQPPQQFHQPPPQHQQQYQPPPQQQQHYQQHPQQQQQQQQQPYPTRQGSYQSPPLQHQQNPPPQQQYQQYPTQLNNGNGGRPAQPPPSIRTSYNGQHPSQPSPSQQQQQQQQQQRYSNSQAQPPTGGPPAGGGYASTPPPGHPQSPDPRGRPVSTTSSLNYSTHSGQSGQSGHSASAGPVWSQQAIPPPPQDFKNPKDFSQDIKKDLKAQTSPPVVPRADDTELQQMFRTFDSSKTGQLSSFDLQNLLAKDSMMDAREDCVKMLMNIFDTDRSGTINFMEFEGLYRYIQDWYGIFLRFDKDGSGLIDRKELHQALLGFGFSLPSELVRKLEKRYAPPPKSGGHGNQQKGIAFDRFLMACVTVKHFTEAFRRIDQNNQGRINVDYNTFMELVLDAPS